VTTRTSGSRVVGDERDTTALALVSEEDDISLVFEEVDFGDTPYTYCYVTGGWKEYDTDDMTLYSKEEGMHAVPPSF